MAGFDVFSLRNLFAEQGVMMCFSGPFSHSIIEELGVAVKHYLLSADAPKDRMADVFAVFVEQAQNLKNYTARPEFAAAGAAQFQNGTLAIAREMEHYVISSGNLIRRDDSAKIMATLDSIIHRDKTQLKDLYKQRLRGPDSGSGGAGLGFIDMARKASKPVWYSIRELPDGTDFFNIAVVV